jgi:hypothetical protein
MFGLAAAGRDEELRYRSAASVAMRNRATGSLGTSAHALIVTNGTSG